jgi:putative AlgH/UPF0301 family transcriptional regulator
MATQREDRSCGFSSQRFLVASPYARGTPYERQVVYVLEHDPRRAMGLLLDEAFRDRVQRLRALFADPVRLRSAAAPRWIGLPVGVVVWEAGQLDAELRMGVWLKAPARLDQIFGDCQDLWVDLVRQIGRSVLHDALRIEQVCSDPSLN